MSPFHPGELAVQERAGVRDKAARVGGSIRGEIPPAAQDFLEERGWIVLAAADAQGRPWASLLAGEPGFARVTGPREIRLDASPAPGDPLEDSLHDGALAGLLAIDPPTRRRMRVNGRLAADGGVMRLVADQVYSNCPRHIVPRADALTGGRPGLARRSGRLEPAHQEWIRRADTFFIGTVNPGEGADASHRGGPAGFVEVAGDRLRWPDYAGNMMYNTLGNIAAYPRAGLLFVDFERGGRLMITGRAGIDWDPAQRMVELAVDAVVELATP